MADEKPKSEEKPKKPKGGGEKQEKGKAQQANCISNLKQLGYA